MRGKGIFHRVSPMRKCELLYQIHAVILQAIQAAAGA
jgi:hypothetical protein